MLRFQRTTTGPRRDRGARGASCLPSKTVIFAYFFAVFSAVGCGSSADRALQGRWFGDSVENFDPADVASATGWAKGASLEFSSGVLTVAIPAEDPRKGHYEVESAHDGDLVVAVRDDHGTVDRTRLTLDGDRFLKWHVDDRKVIVLRRED
ncbi:MAG TPA: hypothetical protein VH142_03315 [Polyangiaceae bacterium]|nr:hypothetical protein [Polyangiaceae bacterium]